MVSLSFTQKMLTGVPQCLVLVVVGLFLDKLAIFLDRNVSAVDLTINRKIQKLSGFDILLAFN